MGNYPAIIDALLLIPPLEMMSVNLPTFLGGTVGASAE